MDNKELSSPYDLGLQEGLRRGLATVEQVEAKHFKEIEVFKDSEQELFNKVKELRRDIKELRAIRLWHKPWFWNLATLIVVTLSLFKVGQ